MEGEWKVNENELAEIKAIADSNLDTPVLMININKYNDGEYPNGETYLDYLKILPKILDEVGAEVLWQLPVLGQPVGTKSADEMLGIWYPSHKSFLSLPLAPSSVENFRIKNACVSEQECIDVLLMQFQKVNSRYCLNILPTESHAREGKT